MRSFMFWGSRGMSMSTRSCYARWVRRGRGRAGIARQDAGVVYAEKAAGVAGLVGCFRIFLTAVNKRMISYFVNLVSANNKAIQIMKLKSKAMLLGGVAI